MTEVSEEPIHVVGLDADGVTKPAMDNTAGSALYRVPLLLSRRPDPIWSQLLQQNWDHPPSYTLRHRPGIGRVIGQAFVLDGTTVEEVEDYHLATLQAAVDVTNSQYAEHLAAERVRKAEDAAQTREHEEEVAKAAERIRSRLNQ